MKKIIFLRANPDATGGAERYLKRLKNELTLREISSEIRSFKGNSNLSSWTKAISYNRQVCKQKSSDEFYFSLERIVCSDIYRAGDGVHKVYMRTKPFWFLNPLNFVYPYLEKKCFENAKAIIVNSNFIRKQIIETYGVSEDKIHTIYNGVNLPRAVEKGRAKFNLCNEFHLNYELPIILFVGSGFKRKGLREFFTIISKLKTKVNTVIVGSDKNIDYYKNLAKKLGLKPIFTGIQRSTAKFYEAADVFLFPTHYEPFSNVVLEALSYGCATFTTAQNGASEILDREFIMPTPYNFKICPFIDDILNDNDALREIQERNLALSQRFSIEKNANLTMEVINEYLD